VRGDTGGVNGPTDPPDPTNRSARRRVAKPSSRPRAGPGGAQARSKRSKRTKEPAVAGNPPAAQNVINQAQNVIKQMHNMQQQLVLMWAELAETEVTGTADEGLVTVTMRGNGEVTRVVFDQAAIDEGDAGSLAALTLTAIRRAADAVKSLTTEKMAKVTAGLKAALGIEADTH
jgi:nucleoid-associated protein EbfC